MKRLSLALVLISGLRAEDPRLVIESGGHLSEIWSTVFTRDGKYVVTAGDDKVVRVWDVGTGRMFRTIRGQIGDGHEGKLYAAALSPDNRYLAVAGWLAGNQDERCAVRIHDFQTGAVIAQLKGHTSTVFSLAFSPDGRHLASGDSDGSIRIWDVEARTSVMLSPGHQNVVAAVAFSPDGKRLVSASYDHSLRLWDVTSAKLIAEMPGHQDEVNAAVFSPDGKHIVSGSDDKTIRLWDAKTGRFIRQLAETETKVGGLSFSPDGSRLLAGAFGYPYVSTVFEFPSGKVLTQFRDHTNIVPAVAISPDGATAVTAGGNREEIYIWSLSTGKAIRRMLGAGQPVFSVAFSKDGHSIALGNTFSFVGANERGPLERTIQLSPGGQTPVSLGAPIKSAEGLVRAIERSGAVELHTKRGKDNYNDAVLEILRDGKSIHEIERDGTSGWRHRCYSFTPDGQYVVSGAGSGFLTLYSTESGKAVAGLIGHTSEVWAVAVSPDSHTLVSGSDDQTVRLWDLPSGRNLLSIFIGEDQEWVAWTPQGYYTSSVNGDKYIGWHLNRGVDQLADFYPAAQFQKQFYRPDIISEYLKTRDIEVAVRNANAARGPGNPAPATLGPQDVTAMLPPMISISSPDRDEITVQDPTLRVRAEALSNTLPIADVKVLLNGVQVSGAAGTGKGDPRRRRVEVEVQLAEGRNILSIIASNEKAMSEPETRRIYYKSASGAGADSRPALFVLAIGISEYDKPAFKLHFAAADATDVQSAFEKQKAMANGLYSRVETRLVPQRDASRSNILRGLSWLSQEGTQNDFRVLFLSGHGGLEGHNYYFYSRQHDPNGDPEDSDISWSVLMDRLTSAKSKVVLFVDTCHAAAVTGSQKKGDKTLSQIIKDMKNDYYGVATFAAATGEEDSVERAVWGHGAFTKALLEGLDGAADLNHDGVVETEELGAWIAQRVRELTGGNQHAIFTSSPGLPSFALYRVHPQ